jgi:hypothetical protein
VGVVVIVHQTGVRREATGNSKNWAVQKFNVQRFKDGFGEELPRFGSSRNVEMTISSRGEGEIISSPGGVMS